MGLFDSVFGKTNPYKGLNSSISSGFGAMGLGVPGSSAVNPSTSTSSFWSNGGMASGLGSGLLGGLSGILQGSTLNGQEGLTDTQKSVNTATSITNGVTNGLMSSGVVPLMAVGAGLKAVDFIGGKIVGGKTSAAASNFKINQDVTNSSGYSGTASNATDAKKSGDAFKSAGLFGKLASNQGKIRDGLNNAAGQQSLASGVLQANKLAIQSAQQSTGMFANNLIQKNYNSDMWNNGSVTYGEKGMAINHSGSTPTKTSETFNKLGKAAKSVNLGRMKALGKKVQVKQQGGVMQQDHTATAHNDPYNQWTQTLPERLRGSVDYDLKGYFDKYGPVKIEGDTHLTDKFKKPNHVTFSNESKYSKGDQIGGQWKQSSDNKWEFTPSAWNLKNVGVDSLQNYFRQNEPEARLRIPTHENGGAINVIAEGAFHSRKHALKDVAGLDESAITLKGIPVVSEGEGGSITQHAEVERNELILHYDLTKQLEELHKEGTEEAAIKAGQLLAKEIVKNTRDSSSKILKNA